MGWKIIYAPVAIERLQAIVELIAKENPDAARRMGFRLIERSELLGEFPELGRPYRKRRDVRRLLCKPYVIYYRLNREQKAVEVMDFWHSAQLDPKL
jgi:plasmid stabilization system protein ParE